ncbi:MAG: DUF4876 domain-containing protein [Chitinophagaceae bacterium]
MKQIKTILTIVLLGFLTSCSKHDNEASAIDLSVTLSFAGDDQGLGLPLENATVTINNNTNGQSYSAKTNASGIATFSSIVPGNYSANATLTITAANYIALTGIPTEDDIQYNASITGTSIISANSTFAMTLEAGRIGDLVIKQFYYAGSNTSQGAGFRDEFVEIYNNSNDTIFLDSLYIGNTWANTNRLSTGAETFDWSQSIGMPTGIGDASKDYLYFRYLFMIPGSGVDHPLAPGQSIVIAQTAINHAETYTDNSGRVQSIIDPTLTVDLSKADWETYLVDYNRTTADDPASYTPYRWDLDNPLVPNITVFFVSSSNDWVFDATGREDLLIFKIPGDKPTTFPTYPAPNVTAVTSNTKTYMQIPASYIIDAVEIETPIPANRTPKRLPNVLDAGPTFVTGGQYSSQSLVRKTAKTLTSGRRVLQDTNNSEADFFTKTKADPSKTDASFTE